MASPQVEQGYTRIANELLDAILKFGFSKRQMAVLFAIIRKTYGFNKTEDDMTVTQLAEQSGLRRAHASEALKELSEDIEAVLKRDGKHGYVLKLQKNYKNWNRPKTGRVPKRDDQRPKTGRSASQNGTHKRQLQKTTPKDNPLYPPQGLPECVPAEAWLDFVAYRKQAKNVLTEEGAKRAANKLVKLHEQGHSPKAVIDQTIERGWSGFFGLKGDQTQPQGANIWRDAV